jgi:hypothetical protein
MNTKTLCRLSAVAMLALGTLAYAGTITDTNLNVSYTATSSFSPVSGNTYDVFLTVDPTHFSAGTGFLDAISMQFKTGSDVATVDLLEAPGGVGDWSSEIPGGLNSGGCNGNGANSGDACFEFTSSSLTATDVPGGPYDFEFAVTLPGTDALTAASDIKADYNSAVGSSGRNLGLTSQGITIQSSGGGVLGGPTPEPGTLVLLLTGAGLMGVACYRKRRA